MGKYNHNPRSPEEEELVGAVLKLRFGDICPKCRNKSRLTVIPGRKEYRCSVCASQISPLAGTILGGTRTSLLGVFRINRELLKNSILTPGELAPRVDLGHRSCLRISYVLKSIPLGQKELLDSIYTDWLKRHPDIE